MKIVYIDSENLMDFYAYIDEDMQDDLRRIFFNGIGALDDGGAPVGALVYELKNGDSEKDTQSRIRLLKCENDQISKILLEEYKTAVSDEQVAESYYESPDRYMADRLEENGFSQESAEALDIVVTMADIKRLISTFKITRVPDYILPLSDIFVHQYRTFIKKCLSMGSFGLLDDLAYLSMSWFEDDISSCSVADDKVDGLLLMKKAPSGLLHVLLYISYGPQYQKNLALMMVHTALKIAENYPEDTRIVIRRHNDAVKKLTDRLFAESKGEQVYKGNRSENS